MYLGIIGMLFIILGWLISIRNIPPLSLSISYGIGSFLLTLHAALIGDLVFLVLNVLATIISFINVLRYKRKK